MLLQVLEGQLEVLQLEVEELGDQVEQAVQNWSLEELSRPHSRLSSLNQQLQHQAALRSVWFMLVSGLTQLDNLGLLCVTAPCLVSGRRG